MEKPPVSSSIPILPAVLQTVTSYSNQLSREENKTWDLVQWLPKANTALESVLEFIAAQLSWVSLGVDKWMKQGFIHAVPITGKHFSSS